MIIEVFDNKNDLNRIAYYFYVYIGCDAIKFVLDSYSTQQRESKRHKFKDILTWERLSKKDSNIEKPKVPEEIISRVYDEIILKVKNED